MSSEEFVNKPEMTVEQKKEVIASLESGDLIWVEIAGCPISPLTACVTETDGTNFSLFSTNWILEIGRETDFNAESPNLTKIVVHKKADVAVEEQSNKNFKKCDKLKVVDRDNKERIVTLVGALNGFLYCLTDDGQPFCGGSSYFEKVEKFGQAEHRNKSNKQDEYETIDARTNEIICAGVKRAQEIARREGLKIGQVVSHPDDDYVYELKEINGDEATVWFPTQEETIKTFPLNELFDPKVARRESVKEVFNRNLKKTSRN